MKRFWRVRYVKTVWRVPLGYIAAALIVGLTLPRTEVHFFPHLVSSMSAAAAAAIGSAVASGMIALTGIVFSLTFVMVQFSAMAYSPRLVVWVARDRVVSHSLGVFTATFLYALAMVAWADRNSSATVPLVSSWLVLGLLVASMGMFIALIERTTMLQVNRMLVFTADQGRKAISDLYTQARGALPAAAALNERELPVSMTLCHSGHPQAIQAVDVNALVDLATASGAFIEMSTAVGDTVVELTPLLRVHGGLKPVSAEALLNAIAMGDERTFEQDPKYAIRLVVDIAIKALSPAINDPTTAVQALDQIEDLLLRLGQLPLEIGAFPDRAGRPRLFIPSPTWEQFLLLSLDEILHCGATSVQVMRRMRALLTNLRRVLPVGRHAALLCWEERLQASISRTFPDAEEKRNASVADRQGLGVGETSQPNA
jgi:uncharacterized membrane protein